jgi:excinuclease ABC subunit A
VTGVSGSGKSTLVNDTLYAEVARQIHRAGTEPAAHDDIAGIDYFDKVINVDQSPSAARRAATRQPIPACSRPSAS